MKIICISASQVPSLTANSLQVMKACQGLAQLGHEVQLLVPRFAPRVPEDDLTSFYGLQTPFAVTWLPIRPQLRRYDFCWLAIGLARAQEAGLVYVWPLQAAVFASLRRMPVVLEMHGPPEGRIGPWLFRFFIRLSGKKRILPITQSLAEELTKKYKIDLQPRTIRGNQPRHAPSMVISPNGVDLERFQDLPDPSSARLELGLPQGVTVAYTGHLYAGRGMILLVELARRFPQVNFLWVGGNPADVDKWKIQLEGAHLSNVTLTGFIANSQLPLYQASADILLMPYERAIAGSSGGNSAAYASPMKMFEYMASCRAIISSDLPVIREILNASNAQLCSPQDIEAWGSALQTLLDDKDRRIALGEKARQDVQQYTWQERARKALTDFV